MKKQNTQSTNDEGSDAVSDPPKAGYEDTFTDMCVVSEDQVYDEGPIKSFTTSQVQQSPQLREYLEELLLIPFNTFCIDCKENRTTHAVVWLGAFVCKKCADDLIKAAGGN